MNIVHDKLTPTPLSCYSKSMISSPTLRKQEESKEAPKLFKEPPRVPPSATRKMYYSLLYFVKCLYT